MVTQLYTAPLKPYRPQAGQQAKPADVSQDGENGLSTDANGKSRQPSSRDASQGSSNGSVLSAAQDQTLTGVISMQAVINDFENTMDALGVSPDVRQEVSPYLQVVAHQAQKPQPAVGLIKQNLKVAADTMDGFITDTLGQPSKVVREWVDALLMQPIEYQSQTPIKLSSARAPAQADIFKVDSSSASGSRLSSSLSNPDTQWAKTTLTEAGSLAKAGQTDQAMAQYSAVLDKSREWQQPALEGRALYQMGQLSRSTNAQDVALAHFSGAQVALAAQPVSALKVKVSQAVGNQYQALGNAEQAASHLDSAVNMARELGDSKTLSQTLYAHGQFLLRQGQPDAAGQALQEALSHNQNGSANPAAQAKIYQELSSLARLNGNRSQAFDMAKQAYLSAKTGGSVDLAKSSLSQAAALYLDAGKPEAAQKLLSKALG